MNRYKLIAITSIIGIVIAGSAIGCNSENKLITQSLALDIEKISNEEDINEEVQETDIIKQGNLINSAKNYAVRASKVSEFLLNPYKGEEKQVFLTFDDGPSESTDKVLEILANKGVHGTFFVLGESLDKAGAEERLKSTITGGHAIANHTYSHDYNILYPKGKIDSQAFVQEIDAVNTRIKQILGENFRTDVVRMPGGYMTREYYKDPNLESFDSILEQRGIVQLDWTAENGDGVTKKESLNQMLNRVYEQVKGQKSIVLLMHDSKGKNLTIEALPIIIDYFKEQGFKFKVIANNNVEL